MSDSAPAPAGEAGLDYTYRPSLAGRALGFSLRGDALDWRAGRKIRRGRACATSRRMRLSFPPRHHAVAARF